MESKITVLSQKPIKGDKLGDYSYSTISSVNDKTTISPGAVVAARSRFVVCYHILLHPPIQRLVTGSLGVASEGRCQGRESSRAAVEAEVVYTTEGGGCGTEGGVQECP